MGDWQCAEVMRMVMTIGRMTDALIDYCATTRCDKCKIMGRYNTCRLSEVQAEINDMFETVYQLDKLCKEIEKENFA